MADIKISQLPSIAQGDINNDAAAIPVVNGSYTYKATPNALVLGAVNANSTGTGSIVLSNAPTIVNANLSGTSSFPNGTADGVLYLDGAKVATSGSGLVFNTNGNLGIGTNSPGSRLSVTSAGTALAQFTGAEYSQVRFSDGTRTLYTQVYNNLAVLATESNTPLAFGTNNAEKMRLDASGNLGIGTTSPNFKLDVQDTVGATVRARTTSAGNAGLIASTASGGTAYLELSTNVGQHYIYGGSGGTQNIAFSINGEKMRLDASGNLGLEVTPSAWGNFKAIQINTVGNGAVASPYLQLFSNAYYNGSNYIYTETGAATRFDTRPAGNAGFAWHVAPSGTAGAAITFTQAMTLDASGNLGVGTTDAYGRVNIQRFVGAPQSTLTIGDFVTPANDVGLYLRSTTTAGISWAGGALAFYSAGPGNTERARIDSSGNFGVGTTSPTDYGAGFKTIAVNGTSGGIVQFKVADVSAGYLTADANALSILAQGSRVLSLYTNDSERARIDSSGNFGVGTIAPIAKASIENASAGDGLTIRSNGINTNKAGANNALLLGCDYTTAISYVVAGGSGTNTALAFYTAAAAAPVERARIDSSGSLLLKTTTSGSLASGGMIVNPTGDLSLGNVAAASGTAFCSFLRSNVVIGSITQDGTTAILYNTTSDQRLKTNIADAPDASALIDAIKVRSFDWISDDSHQRYGMVAQELFEVAPEAVHAPANPDEMMAVDYSKLVPMLVKEIQSLRARVAALEA